MIHGFYKCTFLEKAKNSLQNREPFLIKRVHPEFRDQISEKYLPELKKQKLSTSSSTEPQTSSQKVSIIASKPSKEKNVVSVI